MKLRQHLKFLVLLIIFFNASCSNDQHEKTVVVSDTSITWPAIKDTSGIRYPQDFVNTLVALIEKKVRQIDSTVFQDSIYLENEDFLEQLPDGGASLTGFFNNGRLMKIKDWIGLSYGIKQHSYYFNNDHLIYVSENEDDFDVNDSTGIDHSKFGQHSHGGYYFNNLKLINMETLGHNTFEDAEYEPQKAFLEACDSYRKLLLYKHKKSRWPSRFP